MTPKLRWLWKDIIDTWVPLGSGTVYIWPTSPIMLHTHKIWKTFFRGTFTHCFPLGVWHRSEDFKQLHLWLVWELSTVHSLTQVVFCYLACGWYFPQPLGLHFSHSLALSACVPLRGLIGRLSHRETGRDISHAELIACGGSGGSDEM